MTLRWEWDTQGLGGPSRTPTPHLPVQGSGACSGAAETKRLCQNQTTLLLCLELGCGLQAADPPPESALWRQEDLDGPTAQWVVSRLPGPAWLSRAGRGRPGRAQGNTTRSARTPFTGSCVGAGYSRQPKPCSFCLEGRLVPSPFTSRRRESRPSCVVCTHVWTCARACMCALCACAPCAPACVCVPVCAPCVCAPCARACVCSVCTCLCVCPVCVHVPCVSPCVPRVRVPVCALRVSPCVSPCMFRVHVPVCARACVCPMCVRPVCVPPCVLHVRVPVCAPSVCTLCACLHVCSVCVCLCVPRVCVPRVCLHVCSVCACLRVPCVCVPACAPCVCAPCVSPCVLRVRVPACACMYALCTCAYVCPVCACLHTCPMCVCLCVCFTCQALPTHPHRRPRPRPVPRKLSANSSPQGASGSPPGMSVCLKWNYIISTCRDQADIC